jgi:Spt20 family
LQPCPSRLLKKLVAREGLGVLLLQLFPGDQGYKVSISDNSSRAGFFDNGCVLGEASPRFPTIVSSYEEDELLPYIDREELPPAIAELLEDSPVPLFYAGCVVAEVLDMRHCPAGHSRYVLLKPTDQVWHDFCIDTFSITNLKSRTKSLRIKLIRIIFV